MAYGTAAVDTINTSGNLTVTGNVSTSGNLTVTGNTQVSGNIISTRAFHTNISSQSANTAPIFNDVNGTQIGTLARAWVACNGSTTILRSFNVTSITDNGTGQITVNFTNPLPSANCAVVATNRYRGSGSFETTAITSVITANSVSTGTADIVSGATVEVPYIAVAVFG